MAERDLYEVLGVARNATDDELKRAYRRKARELHPDTNPDDPASEAEFKQVTVAYEILSDPQRRQQYDRFGLQGVMGGQPGGPEWQAFSEGGLGDLFEAFFGAMGGAPAVTCSDCNGTGELRRVRQSILGQVVSSTGCPTCHATGATIATPCTTCHGDGRTTTSSTLVVNVPAGVEDGSTMRLTGRGPAGFRGGPLYVHLGVEYDPRFERVGDDLHVAVSVSIAQAALGAVATVSTLEGDEPLDVERGTQPGTVIRLRQRGVTHLRGRGRGDLLAHVEVQVPRDLDEETETMLRSLAAHRGESVAEPHAGLFSRLRSRH